MELLDMVPADAIALRLYSLPAAVAAAASLYYAWLVAALAAAVGLWRIHAVSAGLRRGSAIFDDAKSSKAQSPLPSPAIEESRLAAPAAEPAEAASPSGEPSTPSKVRFTAYYGGSGDANDDGVVDRVRRSADEDDDDEAEAVLRRTASAPERRRAKALAAAAPWEEREMTVRRRGDLGWYRHLDMAALDGSVVKLWDGELMTASPRGRRRRAQDWNYSCHFSDGMWF